MRMKKDHRIGNKHRLTHGLTNSPEFYIWRTMKARCCNPKSKSYKRYGGRGITVCERWLNSFENFYKDLGPRPSASHQIDRIDNDKGYTPDNCKWSTVSENSSNRSTNKFLTFCGETKTYTQWSNSIGLNRGAVSKRIERGWTVKQALTIPKLSRKLRHKSPEEIIKILGL